MWRHRNSTGPYDLHKARRQHLNHFFSKPRIAARQDIIDRNIVIFCERISQFAAAGNMLDLGAAINALTRDIACEFVLNKTYASLRRDDFHADIINMLQKGGVI